MTATNHDNQSEPLEQSEALELVSVHFAKSGGTSLWVGLKSAYGDAIFADHEHDPCNSSQRFNPVRKLPKSVRAVHGHIRPDLYPLDAETKLITFLREPAEKLLSSYYFWLNLPPCGSPEHDAFLTNRPDVFEYAEQVAGVAVSAYFAGFDMERFDLIGFHDRRVEHLARLSEMLGFSISSDIALNVTPFSPERHEIENDLAKMRRLRDILKVNVEFYSDMRSRWLPRLELRPERGSGRIASAA